LQFELIKLQEWVRLEGLKVVVIFEGRDAAGKGGVIKRITASLNPRICRVVALGTPTEKERGQWYFQRYVAHLPARGEIVRQRPRAGRSGGIRMEFLRPTGVGTIRMESSVNNPMEAKVTFHAVMRPTTAAAVVAVALLHPRLRCRQSGR
jgi:hypothetical protein